MNTDLWIVRRTDGEREHIASFEFGDLADVAAHAICERYHYTVIRTLDGYPDVTWRWTTIQRRSWSGRLTGGVEKTTAS